MGISEGSPAELASIKQGLYDQSLGPLHHVYSFAVIDIQWGDQAHE